MPRDNHGNTDDHRNCRSIIGSVLQIWPHPDGPQHDEVAAGSPSIPRWTDITWMEKHRDLPDDGTHGIIHNSVYRRFDDEAVRLPSGSVDTAPHRGASTKTSRVSGSPVHRSG